MKTAISIPDELFKKADKIAKKLGQSRSEFYAFAIKDYVQRKIVSDVTARLDEIYSGLDSRLEPNIRVIQSEALKKNSGKEDW